MLQINTDFVNTSKGNKHLYEKRDFYIHMRVQLGLFLQKVISFKWLIYYLDSNSVTLCTKITVKTDNDH